MSALHLPSGYDEIRIKRIKDDIWEIDLLGVPFKNEDTTLKGDMNMPRVKLTSIILEGAELLHEPDSETLYTITATE